MTHRIEVLYFEGCPHAAEALESARGVAARLLPDTTVETIRVETDEQAHALEFPGSPTIRVDGRDVEERIGVVPGLSCRVYEGGTGVPPEWRIEAGLLRAIRPRYILFLCVANSARSQMAEGIARSIAPPEVTVSSAGSEPSSVRPQAVQVLKEIGIDISDHRSKDLDAFDAGSVDAVITLCAEEVCPAFLGKAVRVHWGLPDPAAVTGTEEDQLHAFRSVRNELFRRLKILFGRLEET